MHWQAKGSVPRGGEGSRAEGGYPGEGGNGTEGGVPRRGRDDGTERGIPRDGGGDGERARGKGLEEIISLHQVTGRAGPL